MASKVQILRRYPREEKWSFVAHGAAYTREEFERMKSDANGRLELRALPVREIKGK
jgi:hypothetical protein